MPTQPKLDLKITDPEPGRARAQSGRDPNTSGNELIDQYRESEKGTFTTRVEPGKERLFGGTGAPTVSISGNADLPGLDFRSVEGGQTNRKIALGAAQAARAYRDPYARKTEQGEAYNPIQNRGVGALGIVGEGMQAQREGRGMDPIQGRTQSYNEGAFDPVDLRPRATNEGEQAFWSNWEDINSRWRAGEFVPVGPGSGSEEERQPDAVPFNEELPPRLNRTSVETISRKIPIQFKGAEGQIYASDEHASDILYEEAWEAVRNDNPRRLSQWLIENKGMDPQVAIYVAHSREIEQLNYSIQQLWGGPEHRGASSGAEWVNEFPDSVSGEDRDTIEKMQKRRNLLRSQMWDDFDYHKVDPSDPKSQYGGGRVSWQGLKDRAGDYI